MFAQGSRRTFDRHAERRQIAAVYLHQSDIHAEATPDVVLGDRDRFGTSPAGAVAL